MDIDLVNTIVGTHAAVRTGEVQMAAAAKLLKIAQQTGAAAILETVDDVVKAVEAASAQATEALTNSANAIDVYA